jgi:hypothetical protein
MVEDYLLVEFAQFRHSSLSIANADCRFFLVAVTGAHSQPYASDQQFNRSPANNRQSAIGNALT